MKNRDDKAIKELEQKNFKLDFKNRELKYKQAKEQGYQKPSTDGEINSLLMARTYTEFQSMEIQKEKQQFAELYTNNLLDQQQSVQKFAIQQEPSKKKKVQEQKKLGDQICQDQKDQDIQQQEQSDSSQSQTPFPQDADYKYSSQQQQQRSEDEQKLKNFKNMLNSDDSDEDDQALMLEYQKVKRQRLEEQRRKLRLKAEKQLKQKEESILGANPAMSNRVNKDNHAYSLTRKWHEETVFKNQARKQNVNKKKTFINDTVRSDFHKKFLTKYIL